MIALLFTHDLYAQVKSKQYSNTEVLRTADGQLQCINQNDMAVTKENPFNSFFGWRIPLSESQIKNGICAGIIRKIGNSVTYVHLGVTEL